MVIAVWLRPLEEGHASCLEVGGGYLVANVAGGIGRGVGVGDKGGVACPLNASVFVG